MSHKLICKITLAACLVVLVGGSSAGLCRELQCFGGVDIAPEAEYSSNTREVKYVGRMKTLVECEDACIKYKVGCPSRSCVALQASALPWAIE
jgi:hypothetical protein